MCGQKSILVMSGDLVFAKNITALLGERGLSSIHVANGAEARLHLAGQAFHLIVLDDDVPGQATLQWIIDMRNGGVQTPVLYLVDKGFDSSAYQKISTRLNVPLIVQKPVVPLTLVQEISELVAGTQATPEDLLAGLTAEFVRALPSMLDQVEEAVRNLRANPDSMKAWNQAKSLSHRLKGTAGMYGFEVVSRCMLGIENCLLALRNGHCPDQLDELEIWMLKARCSSSGKQATDQEEQTPAASCPERTEPDQPATVIVIDDDPLILRRVSAVLSLDGMIVHAFSSGDKVEELMWQLEPDLILIDAHMPGREGVEICSQLRQLKLWSDLPVIFLTADASVETRSEAYNAGATDYLVKPVVNAELLAKVKMHVPQPALRMARRIELLQLQSASSEQAKVAV